MTHFIFIIFDEHQAALYETMPGCNFLDCDGDESLKRLYLEQELIAEDMLAWCDGVVTKHCRETLEDIGGLENNDVTIEFNPDSRRYDIRVVERIAVAFNHPRIQISVV
jgi:hypothetical protein